MSRPNKKWEKRLYNSNYYNEKRKKYRDAALVSEVALMKKCAPKTIYENLSKFDLVKNSKPVLVIINDKLFRWEPKNNA